MTTSDLRTEFTLTLGEAGMPEVTFTHDYPYAGFPAREYDHMGGFLTRECCSFAAWWLNRHAGVPFTGLYRGEVWQHADTWPDTARKAGLVVDGRPEPGSIACLAEDETDGEHARGHVGVVAAVRGDRAWLQDYNWLAWSYDVHWVDWQVRHAQFIHFPEPDETERSHARWRVALVREACAQRAGR